MVSIWYQKDQFEHKSKKVIRCYYSQKMGNFDPKLKRGGNKRTRK